MERRAAGSGAAGRPALAREFLLRRIRQGSRRRILDPLRPLVARSANLAGTGPRIPAGRRLSGAPRLGIPAVRQRPAQRTPRSDLRGAREALENSVSGACPA